MSYTDADGQWCKVEIMGYVSHIARCKEVPLLDGRALRVSDETEPGVIYYPLGSIFSLRWLSDEEGEALSADRQLEHGRRTEQREHDAKIAAIQQTIRDVIDGKKMAQADLYAAVICASLVAIALADFVEACDQMGIDTIPGEDGAPTLYWIDPEGFECPF